MLEATPGQPYGDNLKDLLAVEANMILRRKCIQQFLSPQEEIFTLPTYPRLGCPNFTDPAHPLSIDGDVTQSIYIPDEAINPHPRFPTLAANIRKRRGDKVAITIPIYEDVHTNKALQRQRDHAAAAGDNRLQSSVLPDRIIYMDCMAFGMGSGCLQMTFQAKDVSEARLLYDQLAIMAPLLLALTAATPMIKGLLADTDVRWDVISASVDDRDPYERGQSPEATSPGRKRIPKSRYSSIDCFISERPLLRDEYNDLEVVIDEGAYQRLLDAGIDDRLARHVAHLFARDPLVILSDRIDQDDRWQTGHFENLQSTNWNTVRFKPPPEDSSLDINWRVEFRSMELNLTDFENAAHTVFVLLVSRAIAAFGLDFYMPISLVDENMRRAHTRSAASRAKFWVRENVGVSNHSHAREEPGLEPPGPHSPVTRQADGWGADGGIQVKEMTLNHILNGDPTTGYIGLIGYVRRYLDSVRCQGPVRERVERYLTLLGKRASGDLLTNAEWMRRFVLAHPDYKGDSEVSEAVAFDLLKACREIARGERLAPELLGEAGTLVAEAEKASVGIVDACGIQEFLNGGHYVI